MELLAKEIENNKKPWLEKENHHLEAKLEKANKDLGLQRRMTEHYKKLNQIARRKLKSTQRRRPVEKHRKYLSWLGILSQVSLYVSKNR